MKDILSLRLYTRVARLGSFSAAAREAGLAQSQVSRMIADLEASLGARLLSRTTRAVQPTDAGIEFLTRMEPILAAMEDAENSVRDTGELRGVLRIGMPSTMALRVVIPRLWRFAEQHPQLKVELMLDDSWQDMVREAVDVGIRVGSLPDGTGTARLIGQMHRVIVASPDYLARHGVPTTPDELPGHRIVCRQEIDSGGLVALFPEWTMAALPVHAYFPMGRATRLAPRAFVGFISEAIAEDRPAG